MQATSCATTDEVLDTLSHTLGRRRRPLVVGGYGCGNIGDEAILSVILEDLRAIDAAPRVMSVRADETERMHRARALPASPAGLLRGLVSTNALIIGGGGIFSAYMGPRSRRLPDLARAAALLGHAIAFRALGVYASTPPDVARRLVVAMERAGFVSVRDAASLEALRAFGLRREVIVEDDPALRLPVQGAVDRSPNTVGIAVRRVRDPANQKRLERELVTLVDQLQERGFAPVLLAFSCHPTERIEQDGVYAEELRAMCARPDGITIERCRDPRDMLRTIGSLHALVAMRLHALIFAHVTGTQAVAIPYDDKCRSFLDRIGARIAAIEPDSLAGDAILQRLGLHEQRLAA